MGFIIKFLSNIVLFTEKT